MAYLHIRICLYITHLISRAKMQLESYMDNFGLFCHTWNIFLQMCDDACMILRYAQREPEHHSWDKHFSNKNSAPATHADCSSTRCCWLFKNVGNGAKRVFGRVLWLQNALPPYLHDFGRNSAIQRCLAHRSGGPTPGSGGMCEFHGMTDRHMYICLHICICIYIYIPIHIHVQ